MITTSSTGLDGPVSSTADRPLRGSSTRFKASWLWIGKGSSRKALPGMIESLLNLRERPVIEDCRARPANTPTPQERGRDTLVD